MATTTDKDALLAQGKTAQAAAKQLARASTEMKNQALINVANALETEQEPILIGNRKDYDAAKAGGMDDAMLDRLLLSPERLLGMARDVGTISGLPDPVEEVIDRKTLENGLGSGTPARTPGRHRKHLRKPPEHHCGHCGAYPEVG